MARRSTKARRAAAQRTMAYKTATGFPLRVREAQAEERGARGIRPLHPTLSPDRLRLRCSGCDRRRHGCRSVSDPIAGVAALLCPGCRTGRRR